MPLKRRRRFNGLYYHSSPPKVIPINGLNNRFDCNKFNGCTAMAQNKEASAFVIKPSNIRIWIHDKDIEKLTKVLWAGQGNRLIPQITSNAKVKRFLENVPCVMNVIKSVHQAVVENNLETLQSNIEPPVPESLVTTKDANGLSVLHKAAGLGYTRMTENLIETWPNGISDIDYTGKTPLHWAAASYRSNPLCYNLLVDAGADEEQLDYRMRSPAYYKYKPSELDKSLLSIVPDAPRIPNDAQPDWDILIDDRNGISKENKKDILLNGLNLLTSRSKVNSIDDISEPEDLNERDRRTSAVKDTIKENYAEANELNASTFQNYDENDSQNDEDNDDLNGEVLQHFENGKVNEEENLEDNIEKKTDTKTPEELNSIKSSLSSDQVSINGLDSQDDLNEDTLKTEELNTNHENQISEKNIKSESDDEIELNEIENDSEIPTSANSIRNGEPEILVIHDDNNSDIENETEIINNNLINNNENFEDIQNKEILFNDDENENYHKDNEVEVDDDDDDEAAIENQQEPQNESPEKNSLDLTNDLNQIQKESEDIQNESFEMISGSSASEISGIIEGESDDNQVQSQNDDKELDYDAQIQSAIDSEDMEKLAEVVLSGDGNKLLNIKSDNPGVQAFLDNVEVYMNKIRRVHEAARNGDVKELQAALDRRKFAIAKDIISPNGATPLHVAIIFGHSAIVRYLSGRFPETTTAVDNDERTPLHYAAVINDNCHLYNLLTHFGSNPKALDKFGHSPAFYMNHKNSEHILSHRELLGRFGVNKDPEEEMLSDQVNDDSHSARRPLDDPDILTALEHCFLLIYNLKNKKEEIQRNLKKPQSATSLKTSMIMGLSKHLKRSIFDKIKFRVTRLDHTLFDVIWPAIKYINQNIDLDNDPDMGVIAPDFDVYVVFQEFLVPLIKDVHSLNLSEDFKPHPQISYFPIINNEITNNISFIVDQTKHYVRDGCIECSRNLENFELPINLSIGQIEQSERILIENILTIDFAKAIFEQESGTYYTLSEVIEQPSEIRTILATSKLLLPLLNNSSPDDEAECLAINGRYWPYGRGVFLSHNRDLAAWINVKEHLRILVTTPSDCPSNIGYAYSKIGRAMVYLEERVNFIESYFLGYLSSSPSFLGTSLKLTLTMNLPHLLKEPDNLYQLCLSRGLRHNIKLSDNNVSLTNMQSLGITEWRLFQDFCAATTNIMQLEKDAALTNSTHFATALLKIFRRKKNSLKDV